jgi:D-alanine-D-alanine ligase
MIYNKNGDGKLYFLEINTHPGFTALSQVPDTAARNGIEFTQLVQMLIEDANCEISCTRK